MLSVKLKIKHHIFVIPQVKLMCSQEANIIKWKLVCNMMMNTCIDMEINLTLKQKLMTLCYLKYIIEVISVIQQQWCYGGSYTTTRTAYVSYAITRLIAVITSHLSHIDYHQQESMPQVFWPFFPIFWYSLTFSPFLYFFYFFPSSLLFPCLFSSSPNFLASEFPSQQQITLFPSAASFLFQLIIKLVLTTHIIVRLLLVTVENCICWFRRSLPVLYFFLVP